MTIFRTPSSMASAIDRLYGFDAYRDVTSTNELQRTQEELQAAFGESVQPIDLELSHSTIRIPVMSRRASCALVHDVLQQGETGITTKKILSRITKEAEIKRYRSIDLPLDVFHASLDDVASNVYTLSLRTRLEGDLMGIEDDRRSIVKAAYDDNLPYLAILGESEEVFGIQIAKIRGAGMVDEITQCRPMRAMRVPLGRLIIDR